MSDWARFLMFLRSWLDESHGFEHADMHSVQKELRLAGNKLIQGDY